MTIAPVSVARSTIVFGLKLLLRPGHRVAQHQPAFGVGVDHLDRLARHGGDDVARALGVAVGHVLDQAADADDVGLGLAQASAFIAPTTAPAPPMSHFIASMPCAGLIEMPPVSKVTPLPTNATGASPSLAAVPAQDQQPRLADRALRDAEQRAHAELRHRRAVEHLDLEAECPRARRARARRSFRDR